MRDSVASCRTEVGSRDTSLISSSISASCGTQTDKRECNEHQVLRTGEVDACASPLLWYTKTDRQTVNNEQGVLRGQVCFSTPLDMHNNTNEGAMRCVKCSEGTLMPRESHKVPHLSLSKDTFCQHSREHVLRHSGRAHRERVKRDTNT